MTSTTSGQPRTRLNQVIAIRSGVKTDTHESVTGFHRMGGKKDLFKGQSRVYKPTVDGDFVYPNEDQVVQLKAVHILSAVQQDLARLFDVNAMLDWSNQEARASVVITATQEPITLLVDVPVTYLMFLEKQLVTLETLIRGLPVLDATEQWVFDPTQDIYRSAPVGTTKTKKIRRNHLIAPATDKHAAQVEVYTEDEPIGTWTTTKFSGALPASQLNKMLDRVKMLAEAVKFAREQANLQEASDPKPGRRVLDFVFNVEA